ncbi:GH92 family glycosyl hydrolase [Mangrovibacterium diazotrophicum]|uniref:Putative alpha-1,2-mannosidase n=1 Tax=Mangrovibacterium diazotrophicum TaxID=1261403 RepID=A0A419W4H5_9BACT|nr:GH92 family glycosyl hydrolase [Mangrovibacterium diazotrophicum]RKD90342.1 putative alpha-1,2-mannosidase [Mangrovibacterium diazotrophicum]
MIKRNIIIAGLAIWAIACSPTKPNTDLEDTTERLTDFVDPFIGTGLNGHTFPGAAYPFGQIQLSPDNGTEGWDWSSGYHYSDSIVSGFSHLHLSGTGIGDLTDISFLPTTQKVSFRDREENADFIHRYADKYAHENESASPGYYAVKLENTGISAEFTVTERVGFHHYSFPKDSLKNLILNLGFAINWDETTKSNLNIVDSTLVTGMRFSTGWAADQHVYFAARFSQPITQSEIRNVPGNEEKVGVLSFSNPDLLVKVGLSSVSVENALKNLDQTLVDWDFDRVRKAASDAWENELQKIKIEATDNEVRKILYTALYHTMIQPALFSDLNGEFKGVDGSVKTAKGYKRYTIFSLWDTYRSLHPLFTLIEQPRVNDMIKSMLDHYEQTGILPVWELDGNETFCMVGNHSITVIAEAILKGIGDFDYVLAYQAMKESSMQDRDGMAEYDRLGFIPADKIKESVSKLMEIAVSDYSVAKVAEKLGKADDAEYFRKRAQNYKNIYDEQTGFFRGKMADGNWTTPFDPTYSDHQKTDYTEGNGWQYLWLVPQDVDGLIDLVGGKDTFAERLDQFFELKDGVKGINASLDISGLIGGYAHGNEPSHHISFLYNYVGKYWKTQELNRKIQTIFYSDQPGGLIGNEDCGQMSAWYILSVLGFYPVHSADLVYQLGSPLVQKAEVKLLSGKTLTILAPNASPENKYVQEVKLNGEKLNRSYITHAEIMDGAVLEFTMGEQPNLMLFHNN